MLLSRKRRAAPVHHPRTPDYGDLSVEHAYGATLEDARSALQGVRTYPNNERADKEDDLARLLEPRSPIRRTVIAIALLVVNPFRKNWPR